MTRHVEVQPAVRQRIAPLGEQGERWLVGLPDVVADLERRWSLTVGQPLMGGTASYVARARTAEGRDAVLKVEIPGLDFDSQVRTIAAAEGRGYVHLLAHDLAQRAMLLEALGPPMGRLDLPAERMIAKLCQTLRQAWSLARPAGLVVDPAQEKARALGDLVSRLWEKLHGPCTAAVADQAMLFSERRAAAFDPDRCVVVHGDPHPNNALRVLHPRPGAESGFVFVDPDGFLADPAYDLGVVLRDWCPPLLAGNTPSLARRYCRLLAAESGIDETAIWEWGLLERVSTGLFLLNIGAVELGRPFLSTAERLLGRT
jgi:streptomycin 6-kinase